MKKEGAQPLLDALIKEENRTIKGEGLVSNLQIREPPPRQRLPEYLAKVLPF